MEKIRYADLVLNDMVDSGNGWAVSLWMQGCPHHCKGCHNPETWSFEGGQEEDLDELIKKIESALFANGITRTLSILGGEPLCPQNIEYTYTIMKKIKEAHPEVEIYVWTGYIIEELFLKSPIYLEALKLIDVLIDGPFILEQRDITLKLRGSTNQRVIKLRED